jgi:hypothetical protein
MLATKPGVSPKEQLAGFQSGFAARPPMKSPAPPCSYALTNPAPSPANPSTQMAARLVGTIFGGSMYSAVDPIYMVMLIRRLGKDYLVWDKAASIQFKKPGRETLHARFVVKDGELAAIRAALETQRSIDRTYWIELKDSSGTVCATVEKLIYIRKR